jgi:catechol 2,3-dioxygenase-like lactoylglutathione lyase family enzyme
MEWRGREAPQAFCCSPRIIGLRENRGKLHSSDGPLELQFGLFYAPPRRQNVQEQVPVIDHLDHIVLTTAHTEQCIDFYTRVLGMRLERFGEGRMALKFGSQKINLHEKGGEFEPKATLAAPGTLDLCFIASVPLDEVITRLNAAHVAIIEGPVMKTGANWPIRSVYVRDPDRNLVEISERAG